MDEALLRARIAEGDADAMVQLANRLLDPRDPLHNAMEGQRMLRQAAGYGSPLAMMGLGQRFLVGMGVPCDQVVGERWLGMAAEMEFPPAMEAWGRHKLATEPAEGADWLRRAAEAGFAPAMPKWAECLLAGVGVARDEAEGERWLAAGMAADMGAAFAIAGRRRLTAEPVEGERLLAEALRRRDVGAGLELGLIRYLRRDFDGAAKAWAACLKLGAESAAVNVAAMARRGEWPADRPPADVEALLAPIAATGEPFAVINLALWRHAEGALDDAGARAAIGRAWTGPDLDAARGWWGGLAAAGDPEGARVLAWLPPDLRTLPMDPPTPMDGQLAFPIEE